MDNQIVIDKINQICNCTQMSYSEAERAFECLILSSSIDKSIYCLSEAAAAQPSLRRKKYKSFTEMKKLFKVDSF